MPISHIRNFCIIAHIDHGKSTLADRLLEITGTVDQREMKEQVLDQMELERERGITIKLAPVRMQWRGYQLNLIDTPGHVDFTYEVSRSLAAVEGAILLVDATQGIEAQTLANLHLAQKHNLVIIPVINKIDLPAADVERVAEEIVKLLQCQRDDIIAISAKTGVQVEQVLEAVVERIPPPTGEDKVSRALIFDSFFDSYRGVVVYVRIFGGSIRSGDKLNFIQAGSEAEALEVGCFTPKMQSQDSLDSGEIGYIVTNLKNISEAKVGDTITTAAPDQVKPLPGYEEVKPMVFAGIYPKEGNEFQRLREAIEKLKLNDAALTFTVENSPALGVGFRCGFLGMLHLEIFQQRLQREYNIEVITTVPSVAYKVYLRSGEQIVIKSPQEFPQPEEIERVEEPIMKVDIFTPAKYIGNIMKMATSRRGEYIETEYLDEGRVILHYFLPLNSLLIDFYDTLKGVSAGFASLNYEFFAYQKCQLVKLDILIAGEKAEALSILTYEDEAYRVGRKIVDALKEAIPRQLFEIKIQAALGGKIVAASRIPPLRKDVTAKLYGGDVTRKRKLLEKQKQGKKRMRQLGSVDIPPEAYLSVFKR